MKGKASQLNPGERNFCFAGNPNGRPNGHPPMAAIHLTGDFEIDAGNFQGARVITNGHALIRTGGNSRGIWVDGVKQDAHKFFVKEPHPVVGKILEYYEEKIGSAAGDLWLIFWKTVKASEAATLEGLVADLAVALDDENLGDFSAGGMLDRLQTKIETETGEIGLAKIVQWIRSATPDQLQGERSEIMEEWS